MNRIGSTFSKIPALIGMVHLKPLPGSSGWESGTGGHGMDRVIEAAVEDARALERGGADGLAAENFFDSPFAKGRVEAHTVAAMTLCIREIRKAVSIPVGVNVLRNDGLSALSIAAVTGADFIRVNVLTHAMVTDQGIIEGIAYELSRLYTALGARALLFADVMVKHAYPLGSIDIQTAARDIAHRGGADVIVVSGTGTGAPIDPEELKRVKEAVPGTPLASGSGVTPENYTSYAPYLDFVIIGTWLKKDGSVENPVDPERVRQCSGIIRGKRPE